MSTIEVMDLRTEMLAKLSAEGTNFSRYIKRMAYTLMEEFVEEEDAWEAAMAVAVYRFNPHADKEYVKAWLGEGLFKEVEFYLEKA